MIGELPFTAILKFCLALETSENSRESLKERAQEREGKRVRAKLEQKRECQRKKEKDRTKVRDQKKREKGRAKEREQNTYLIGDFKKHLKSIPFEKEVSERHPPRSPCWLFFIAI